MKTDSQRNDKYVAKTVPTTVGLKVASVLSGMKSGFSTAMNSLVPIEIEIQGVLNGEGSATIQYPFYLCFGRELWALENRGIDGASLISAAQSLKDKWEARLLDSSTLIAIADRVFGITVT